MSAAKRLKELLSQLKRVGSAYDAESAQEYADELSRLARYTRLDGSGRLVFHGQPLRAAEAPWETPDRLWFGTQDARYAIDMAHKAKYAGQPGALHVLGIPREDGLVQMRQNHRFVDPDPEDYGVYSPGYTQLPVVRWRYPSSLRGFRKDEFSVRPDVKVDRFRHGGVA